MSAHALKNLIMVVSKLNGVNSKHAHKIAFGLLHHKKVLKELLDAGQQAYDNVDLCKQCGVFTENRDTYLCNICSDPARDHQKICIVSNVTSLINIEKTKSFTGTYFLLNNLISHVMNIMPTDINLNNLIELIKQKNIKEMVIALNPTVEGQATAFHIRTALNGMNLHIKTIGIGVPLGGDINIVDTHTLKAAMNHLVDL